MNKIPGAWTIPLIVTAMIILSIGEIGAQSSSKVQIVIDYNHNKHVEEIGLDCSNCHQYYTKLPSAGLPTNEICMECHYEQITDSPEEAKLLEYINRDEQVPWRPTSQVPEHVYFSHKWHVVLGKLECSECHGQMEKLTRLPRKQVIPLTMKFCIKCHEKNSISTDCLRCHR
jgi:hypothetical protein